MLSFFFLSDPLSGASKVQRDLPAAFLMLEKTKKLNNSPGCLSTFTPFGDRTSVY